MAYLVEACGKYPPPKPAAERALFRAYGRGDFAAKNKLILHNLRLVVDVAKDIRWELGLDLQADSHAMANLVQDGILGLSRAIEKYDVDDGRAKLSTYAWYSIRSAMHRGYSEDGGHLIRLPANVDRQARQARRVYAEIRGASGREPTDEELLERLGMYQDEIDELLARTRQPLSLDAYVGKDEDGEWQTRRDTVLSGETDTVLESMAVRERRQRLGELLARLPRRESQVLRVRYRLTDAAQEDDPMKTLDEVGRVFNVTRERIRQIEGQSIKKLRALMEGLAHTPLDAGSAYNPESIRAREQRAWHRAHFRSLTEQLAFAARSRTERQMTDARLTEEQAFETRREAAQLAEAQTRLDDAYESSMFRRAIGTVDEASGQLPHRLAYFQQHGVKPPYHDSGEQGPYWLPEFRHQYGTFAASVADLLHGGLQALTERGRQVSLTELVAHVEAYDDSLFETRPEFLAAVLEAQERHGVVAVDRSGETIAYRVRRYDESRLMTAPLTMELGRHGVPPYAHQVMHSIGLLRAGYGRDTAITFSRLRRYWAEQMLDTHESGLRLGMTYLTRAGLIQTGADRVRGHYIWQTGSEVIVTPRVKPSELWYEDQNPRFKYQAGR